MTETQQPTIQERDRDWQWDDPAHVVIGHPADAAIIQVLPTTTVLLHPRCDRGVVRAVSRLEAIRLLVDPL